MSGEVCFVMERNHLIGKWRLFYLNCKIALVYMGANFGGRWIVVGESYTYFLCYVAVYGNLFVFVNMDEYDDLHVFVNNISRL